MAMGPVPARAASGGRVAVLGAGVAGLTAAHELIERGFEVEVYERTALGGKARCIFPPGTGTGGRLDLPGEHELNSPLRS
jgi:protoporphyrinogen oxidase